MSTDIIKEPILAASYGRKSDADSEGLDAQFLGNSQTALREGHRIPATTDFRFEDDDTSGVSKKRRGFDRLLAIVQRGDAPFKRIYVRDKTRLGRWKDPRFHTYLEVLLEQHGVQVRYCEDEHGPIDYENADPSEFLGRHLKGQLDAIMASEERTRLIGRVTEGQRTRVKQGFYPGALAPYGTRRTLVNTVTKVVEVDDVPQRGTVRRPGCHFGLKWASDGSTDVIKRIFREAEAGRSLGSIQIGLQRDGIPNRRAARGEPTAVPTRWNRRAVLAVLRNPLYAGDLVWGRISRRDAGAPVDVKSADIRKGKEAVIAIDFMPNPPVARAQWFAVQAILNGNRHTSAGRRASKPEYLLTGFLRCSSCQGRLFGFTHRGKRRRRQHRYYRHEQRTSEDRPTYTCSARSAYVPAEAMENVVLGTVRQVLDNDRLVGLARRELDRRLADTGTEDRQRELRTAVKTVEDLKRSFHEAGRRVVSAPSEEERSMFESVIASLGGELRMAQGRLSALNGELEVVLRARTRQEQATVTGATLLAAFEQADGHSRKQVLSEVVEHIIVDIEAGSADVVVRSI